MEAAELFNATGDSYSWLNIPDFEDAEWRQRVSAILHFERLASCTAVEGLLTGESWRERLVGQVLAVRMGPRRFAEALFDSLADPRGLAIAPACAALVLALEDEPLRRWTTSLHRLDRSLFDGEIGWSLDKMTYHLGWSAIDRGGLSPNDGKNFESHLAMFRWVRDTGSS